MLTIAFAANVHCHVLRNLWALWPVRDVAWTAVVLRHDSHVRGLSSPRARRAVQGLLSAAGELLVSASYCAHAAIGKAAEGFQRASWTSHHHTVFDRVELPLSLYLYGYRSIYHSRHQRFLPRSTLLSQCPGRVNPANLTP